MPDKEMVFDALPDEEAYAALCEIYDSEIPRVEQVLFQDGYVRRFSAFCLKQVACLPIEYRDIELLEESFFLTLIHVLDGKEVSCFVSVPLSGIPEVESEFPLTETYMSFKTGPKSTRMVGGTWDAIWKDVLLVLNKREMEVQPYE